MTLTILHIPTELIEHLLLFCDPIDVSAFAQSCRSFRQLVYAPVDNHLWRWLYLRQPFDDPRRCVSHTGVPRSEREIDWKGELQRIMRARTIASNVKMCSPEERISVLQTFLDLVSHIPALHSAQSLETSQNLTWAIDVLTPGAIFSHHHWTPSIEERLLRARLHTYLGLALPDISRSTRVLSRSVVYSFQNYHVLNDFGPFLSDGSGNVNWEHVKAIHHVLSMQLVDLVDDEFGLMVFPMSLPFTQPVIPPGMDLDEEKDWADVEGVWRCAFCFPDHQELLSG
jgi:hypothetical protein